MPQKEQRVGLRLGGLLRAVLEREAAEQGITLSEHIRRLLLVTHPHIPAMEGVARIRAEGRKVSTNTREYLPYMINQLQQLEEGLRALEGFEDMARHWRETGERELGEAIGIIQETLRLYNGLDEIAQVMEKGLERGGQHERFNQRREAEPDRRHGEVDAPGT
jgi:AcrR family transcriptional regulator